MLIHPSVAHADDSAFSNVGKNADLVLSPKPILEWWSGQGRRRRCEMDSNAFAENCPVDSSSGRLVLAALTIAAPYCRIV